MPTRPPPPAGYANWLDFAVERVDMRGVRLQPPAFDEEADHEAMLDAICAELLELRAKAGQPDTAQRDTAVTQAVDIFHDPIELLSIHEFAEARPDASEDTVRQRLREGSLFVVERSGKGGLPSFQLWNGIAGNPLHAILSKLRGAQDTQINGSDAYSFFVAVSEFLLYLAPLELLLGRLMSDRRAWG